MLIHATLTMSPVVSFAYQPAEFRDFGGFDECFAPGYYEETDLSLRLWKAGRRSRVYPDIRVYHLEYGSFSSEAPRDSLELMTRNKPIFAQRHKDLLDERPEIKPNAGYPVRYGNIRLRILFIEDRVPAICLGIRLWSIRDYGSRAAQNRGRRHFRLLAQGR